MKQARLVLRLWSLMLFSVLWINAGCQKTNPLQGAVKQPQDQKSDKKNDSKDDDDEGVTPPNNIVGSYLVCIEQEQLMSLDQNAVVNCGVYTEPAHIVKPVASLNQWQLSGSSVLFRSVEPSSASVVELRFQAANLGSLKAAVHAARLHVKDDAGDVYEGYVGDLLPSDSRLASANRDKAGAFAQLWNEGFEGSRINSDSYLFYDVTTTAFSTTATWVNSTVQQTACGDPMLQVMRFATWEGGTDAVGAAEGTQFIDTDSDCWPDNVNAPIRGASNLTIGKQLTLNPGRTYRVSFKVRGQPMPPNHAPLVQGLQLKINQSVVKDVRTFGDTWTEYTFDWVARSGVSLIEWSDVGAADDSVGVLLDDLRVQVQNL